MALLLGPSLCCVANDIAVNIRHLERRIALLTTQAVALIAADADLQNAYDRLMSVPGIATRSLTGYLIDPS